MMQNIEGVPSSECRILRATNLVHHQILGAPRKTFKEAEEQKSLAMNGTGCSGGDPVRQRRGNTLLLTI
jgi:hypothetical protein